VSALTKAAVDGGLIAWRNLLHVRRSVDWVFAAVVQPVMFVMLFGFVFGGLLGGAAYREFLLAGILVQTLAFNSAFTVIGLSTDLQKGFIDRLRSLPMSGAAVMVGRTLSDLAVSVVAMAVTCLCGLLIGWRVRGSFLDAVLAFLVLLVFATAMSWIGALIGLLAPSPEAAQSAGLIWLTPLTFVSSGFVPEASMPGPLRLIAEWNPLTAVINAVRERFGNTAPGLGHASDGWPAAHAWEYAWLSSIVIIAVFVPLSMRAYRRVASR
jgi:ABC-2 type transport system permease protein